MNDKKIGFEIDLIINRLNIYELIIQSCEQ